MSDGLPEIAQLLGWTLLHSIWQGLALYLLSKLIVSKQSDPSWHYNARGSLLAVFVAAQVVTFVALCYATPFTNEAAPRAVAGSPYIRHGTFVAPWHVYVTQWIGAWLPWPVFAWAIWMLICAVRQTSALLTLGRLRTRLQSVPPEWVRRFDELGQRVHANRAVRFLSCPFLSAPATFGWLRPVVLIPAAALANISPAYLEAAVLHELAHIRRCDFLIGLAQSLLESVYSFNPFVRLLIGEMRHHAEVSCDSLASSAIGSPVKYAKALVAFAEFDQQVRAHPSMLSLAGSNGSPFESRISWLLRKPVENRRRHSAPALLSGMLVTALTLYALIGSASAANASLKEVQQLGTEPVQQVVLQLLGMEINNPAAPSALETLVSAHRTGTISWNNEEVVEAIRVLSRGADVKVFYEGCTASALIDGPANLRKRFGSGVAIAKLGDELRGLMKDAPSSQVRLMVARAIVSTLSLASCHDRPASLILCLQEPEVLDALCLPEHILTSVHRAISYYADRAQAEGLAESKLTEVGHLSPSEFATLLEGTMASISDQEEIAKTLEKSTTSTSGAILLDQIALYPATRSWQCDYLRSRIQAAVARGTMK